MPFKDEFARTASIRRIAENPQVRAMLGRCRPFAPPDADSIPRFSSPVAAGSWVPEVALGIDGSRREVPLGEHGFAGAEVCFLTVAGVALRAAELAGAGCGGALSPAELRRMRQTFSMEKVVPGCNVVFDGCLDAVHSFRLALFEALRGERQGQDGEDMLATFEALLAFHPRTGRDRDARCPYGEDCGGEGRLAQAKGAQVCGCARKRPIYSTDELRIHEGFYPAGANSGAFGRVMQVLERLWLVHFLRSMERSGSLASLDRLAIVVDGPLAVFGEPSWLAQAISVELARIGAALKAETGRDLLLFGVEKTGAFVDHFAALDRPSTSRPDGLPKGTAVPMTDAYVRRNVVVSDGVSTYGGRSYFGRKLLYKNKVGHRFVVNVPWYGAEQAALPPEDPAAWPRLADVLGVLDRFWSTRYADALIPLIHANEEASIAQGVGGRVLERLVQDLTKPW